MDRGTEDVDQNDLEERFGQLVVIVEVYEILFALLGGFLFSFVENFE